MSLILSAASAVSTRFLTWTLSIMSYTVGMVLLLASSIRFTALTRDVPQVRFAAGSFRMEVVPRTCHVAVYGSYRTVTPARS